MYLTLLLCLLTLAAACFLWVAMDRRRTRTVPVWPMPDPITRAEVRSWWCREASVPMSARSHEADPSKPCAHRLIEDSALTFDLMGLCDKCL